MQPHRGLVLIGLQLIGQEDFALVALRQLEELAARAAESRLDDVGLAAGLIAGADAGRTAGTGAAAATRAAAAAVGLLILAAVADVAFQARQVLYLHPADGKLLA